MLQVLVTDEHNDPRVKVSDTPYIAGVGEKALTFEGDTIPESFAPNTYLVSSAEPVFHPHHETPNPHHYRVAQQQVFTWASKHIHDPKYLAYGLHGHQQKAKIFHVFAVVNVMAALRVSNILGDNWGRVQANLVSWDDFTRRIRITDWTNTLRFNYATFIETPVALFPRLGADFRASMDGSGAVVIDPSLLPQVAAIIPINQ